MESNVSATHPDAPINFLLYHAIELFLKSYLRAKGLSLSEVKSIGHGLRDLATRAEEFGLELDQFDRQLINSIGPNYMAARYIKVGFFSRPRHDDLWATCSWLFDSIGTELQHLGRTRRLPERPTLPQHSNQ